MFRLCRFSSRYTKETQLPYFVERAKLSHALPVYTDPKNNGCVYTIIRHIYGDAQKLRESLLKELKLEHKPERIKACNRLRQVKIVGIYDNEVRKILQEQGF